MNKMECKKCGKRLNKKLIALGAIPLDIGYCSFNCYNFDVLKNHQI